MQGDIKLIFNIIKYIIIYFIFTVFVLIGKIHNEIYFIIRFFPNLEILLTFILFIWTNKDYRYMSISSNNLFVFGLIFDTFNFLPIGLTSVSFLISYKFCEILKQIFINDNSTICFARNFFIYILVFYIIQWFVFSVYSSNFYSLSIVGVNILKDFIYGITFYMFYKKYINIRNV